MTPRTVVSKSYY